MTLAETNITNNSVAISNNSSRIENIESRIINQVDGVDKAISGVNIALALPDSYLNPDEDFAIAGGIGTFGNDTGFALNLTARGDYGWSFGAGVGTSSGEVGGKLQARWAK